MSGGLVDALGWRIVWLPALEGELWVIDECRVVLADTLLTQERVEDALLEDFISTP